MVKWEPPRVSWIIWTKIKRDSNRLWSNCVKVVLKSIKSLTTIESAVEPWWFRLNKLIIFLLNNIVEKKNDHIYACIDMCPVKFIIK